MRKNFALLIACGMCLIASRTTAQVDPERRELIQFGATQSTQGASPVAAYGYYYLNEPDFYRTNLTLRLALAPVYVDSELGILGLLSPHTDVGIGLAGGGFADNYYEYEHGKYFPEESFNGDSGEMSLSLYHTFNPGQKVPVFGVLRMKEHYSFYQRTSEVAPDFVMPHDHSTFSWRAGLRAGGREPLLTPELAGELSAWYEGQYRSASGAYGIDGDRMLQADSHLFWMRALLIYTMPESKQSLSFNFTAGDSIRADRFSAYRLGGSLPLASEFPLLIPGYFYQELSSRDFVCINGQYSIPLNHEKTWNVSPMGALALVDYLPGTQQPGAFNSGAGLAVGYKAPSGAWQLMATYGYGFEAIRSSGRGAQTIGIFCEINLRSKHPGAPTYMDRAIGFFPTHF